MQSVQMSGRPNWGNNCIFYSLFWKDGINENKRHLKAISGNEVQEEVAFQHLIEQGEYLQHTVGTAGFTPPRIPALLVSTYVLLS